MKSINRLYIVAGASAVGFFFGSSMGLASGGTAINLGTTLGLVFGVLALFATWNPGYGKKSKEEGFQDANEPAAEESKTTSNLNSGSDSLDDSLTGMFSQAQGFAVWATSGLCKLWNLEMQFVINIGLMPTLKKFPWLPILLAVLLLALLFPLGVLFVVVAVAAMTRSPKIVNDFKV